MATSELRDNDGKQARDRFCWNGSHFPDLSSHHHYRMAHLSCGLFGSANLGIGLIFLLVANIILFGLAHILQLFHLTVPKEVAFILPRTKSEKLVWVILSVTAGICEETGFRGYVLTKLNLFVNNWYFTIVISSLFFGLGHFYQGTGGIILTGTYGLLFCLLFIWRKSLVPGIFAHFLQDLTALFALSRF